MFWLYVHLKSLKYCQGYRKVSHKFIACFLLLRWRERLTELEVLSES